jgi:hypothetical protein
VLVRLTKAFVIIALVVTTGLHWAALQTVAWATMLAENLQSSSVHDAMTKTFDGQHPCCLCKAIAAAKKSEQKTEFLLQSQKLEFPPAPESLILVAPARFHLLPQADTFAESLTHPPLTPPPRAAFV